MSDHRFNTWRNGWRKPDRRPVYEWLHDNWTLPTAYQGPGQFDVSRSRHLIAPFEAFQSEGVKEVTCMAAIQSGKTLIVEGCIGWAICNSPGPIMWTLQTDDDARKHCNERFMEALKSLRGVRAILPEDRNRVTTTDIYFGPFFLNVNGANLNSLQRVSIRYKFNSEVWLWKTGLLAHAKGRVTAFEQSGNSKVFNESQGGNDGDDFHEAFKAGQQAVWSVKCFGCGKLAPLVFSGASNLPDGARAFVIWSNDARRADGTWNVGRASETAKWRCPSCGHDHDDTARTRAKWNAEGEYAADRLDAPAHVRSYRWEALVARPMADLVAQFLEARRQQKQGVMQAMMDFTRQRRALPWKDDFSTDAVLLRGSGYLLTAPTITDKLDDETARFLTIDRQRDHFWCVARAWRSNGSSRLLYRSRIQTVEQLAEVQGKFSVEPNWSFEDAGYFPDSVYQDCALRGWTALKGSGDNYFNITEPRTGRKLKRMWSDVSWVLKDNKRIPLIHWASDPVKDVLHNLRSGKGAGWEVADDAGAEYESQLNGDRKKEFVNKKTGRQEWRWVRTHANHYWDCEAMQTAAALMLGILASPEPAASEPKEAEVAAT